MRGQVLAWALLLSLWLGLQAVAQWHGVMHGGVHGGVHGAVQPAEPGADAVAAEAVQANADTLFGHPHGRGDGGVCQLFDQLTHADALWAVPPVAGLSAPAVPHRLSVAPRVRSTPAAGAHARGPPGMA
jgi:hypothetical protein